MKQNTLFVALLSGVALVSALAPQAMSQEIGRAGAVNPAASSTPPGAATRTVELGARVIHRERIQTSGQGSLQLVFIDKTTLNIGPNSDLTIDEFVFDPATGTGRMAATLGKGVLRFVGGQVSHTNGATVRTPATTLGIRGGVATITHNQTEGTRAVNHFGRMTVNTATGSEVIRRPGFAITVPNTNAAPVSPTRVTQTEVDASNRQLTSAPRQSGGANNRPTDNGVQQAGVGGTNNRLSPENILVAQDQTVAKPQPLVRNENTPIRTVNEVREVANTGNQLNVVNQTAVAAVVAPPKRKVFALATTIDPNLNSTIPYVLGVAVASGPVYVSPIYGYRDEGVGSNGRETKTARVLQTALSVNGAGASQTSNFMVMTGTFVDTPGSGSGDGFYFSGGFRSFTRRAAGFTVGRANGGMSSVAGTETIDADLLPTGYTVNADFRNDAGTQPDTSIQRPGGGGVSSTYTFTQTVSRVTPPTGLGDNRPAVNLTGFAAGMNRTLNIPLDTHSEPAHPVVGTATLALNPSDSRAQLNLSLNAVRISTTPIGGLNNASIQIGSVDPNLPARSTYIDYDNFGGRDASSVQTVNPGDPGVAVSTANGQSLTFDRTAFASAQSVAPTGSLSGVTFCSCEFTRWGFWSQENSRLVGGVEYRDRVQLGTWVAGEIASGVNVPTTGTATHNGHVFGSFRNGSNQYVAGGQFTQVVNFGTNTGTFSIPSLDGRGYSGNISLVAGNPYYSGSLASVSGPATSGTLAGAFMRGASGPTGEVAGSIVFSGSNYGGAANFVGKQ
jgi:FecR protein